MAEFNECMHKDLPKERFEQLRDETMRAIQDFFVSLVFNDKLCGSGTLVDAFEVLGILTAYHVAKETFGHWTCLFAATPNQR
jgi:hypothetical protein